MKERNDCKIIQDLLPNYIENLTKEETNLYIQEHLKECSECQKILDNMKKELKVNTPKRDDREVNYMKKFSTKLKVLYATVVIILATALATMTYYYFYMRDGYANATETLLQTVSEDMFPDTFYATIEDIYNPGVYGIKSIKVKGIDINDANHRGEYYFDVPLNNIGDGFKIKWNETNINFEQLKIGQTIAIYNYGNILESELTSVRMIVVLEDKL